MSEKELNLVRCKEIDEFLFNSVGVATVAELVVEYEKVVAENKRLTRFLHSICKHPDYEYETTEGPRKYWEDADEPPEGDGWEVNVDEGRDGWERFDYHEEAYWRRKKEREE